MKQDAAKRREKFRTVFEKYRGSVYAVAYSFMKNQADSNDILQEVFLKYYESMDELSEDKDIRPWLLTVTANTCRNFMRSGWFSKTFFTDDLDNIAYEQDFGEESDLFRALMRLPEKERIPVHLFYYEGCSTAEISKILKVNTSTLRVRMMRAREKLKIYLKEESV